jgi:nucleotide-binding universal stress UspA family protein
MKFLVSTDFSKCADNAVKYAVEFALKMNAEICLLNTYQLKYTDVGLFIDFDDSGKKASLQNLKNKEASLKSEYPALSDNQIFVKQGFGKLDDVIEDIKDDYDLVIIGAKGINGLKEILIGSGTARVIGKTSIPTLVIPEESTFNSNSKLFFALDLKESLKRIEVDLINNMCIENKNIHLFHNYRDALEISVKEEQQLVDDFKNYFAGDAISIDLKFDSNTVDSIEKGVQTFDPHVIVVKARHRNLLQSLFHSNVSADTSLHTKQPLLVLKG